MGWRTVLGGIGPLQPGLPGCSASLSLAKLPPPTPTTRPPPHPTPPPLAQAAPSADEAQRKEAALRAIQAACESALQGNRRMRVQLFGSGAHGISLCHSDLDVVVSHLITPALATGGVQLSGRNALDWNGRAWLGCHSVPYVVVSYQSTSAVATRRGECGRLPAPPVRRTCRTHLAAHFPHPLPPPPPAQPSPRNRRRMWAPACAASPTPSCETAPARAARSSSTTRASPSSRWAFLYYFRARVFCPFVSPYYFAYYFALLLAPPACHLQRVRPGDQAGLIFFWCVGLRPWNALVIYNAQVPVINVGLSFLFVCRPTALAAAHHQQRGPYYSSSTIQLRQQLEDGGMWWRRSGGAEATISLLDLIARWPHQHHRPPPPLTPLTLTPPPYLPTGGDD